MNNYHRIIILDFEGQILKTINKMNIPLDKIRLFLNLIIGVIILASCQQKNTGIRNVEVIDITVQDSIFRLQMPSRTESGDFFGLEGVRLCWQSWLPDSMKVKASVVLMHGGNCYGDLPSIRQLASNLSANGYAVYSYDARGFGRSEGKRMHIDNWEQIRSDMTAFLHFVRVKQPNLPIFAYGASFGAAQTLDQAIVSPHLLSGIIIASISTIPLEFPMKSLMLFMGTYFPNISISAEPQESFPGAKIKMAGSNLCWDPLCPKTMTLGFINKLVIRQSTFKDELKYVTIPVFHMQGALDLIAKPDSSLSEGLSTEDVKYKVYEHSGHDMSSEDMDMSIIDIINWLNDHV